MYLVKGLLMISHLKKNNIVRLLPQEIKYTESTYSF